MEHDGVDYRELFRPHMTHHRACDTVASSTQLHNDHNNGLETSYFTDKSLFTVGPTDEDATAIPLGVASCCALYGIIFLQNAKI